MSLRDEIRSRVKWNDIIAADKMYQAITNKWPQINYFTKISYIDGYSVRIATANDFSSPLQTIRYPKSTRKVGFKAWLWRLWYEIMVRVGDSDPILWERGWETVTVGKLYPTIDHPRVETLDLLHVQVYYTDLFSSQLDPFHMAVAYHPATDTLYISTRS